MCNPGFLLGRLNLGLNSVMFFFRKQPLKGMYMAFFMFSTLFFRLPYWLLSSILPRWRSRKSWTLGKAMAVAGMRAYVDTFFDTGFPFSVGDDPDQIAEQPNADEVGFTWVPPLPEELLVGEVRDLARKNNVQTTKVSGYWFCKAMFMEAARRPAGPHEKIVLHLHSGGHVMGSAHPNGGPAGPACSGLLEHCSSVRRIFSCSYRLASSSPFPSKNPFPAGLLDALAAYHYLLKEVDANPQNIIVYGDSSGGNLALALTRYLTVNTFSDSQSFPVPGALLLFSPTVEWAITHTAANGSWKRNQGTDYSQSFFRGYTQRSLLGKLPTEMAYLSPWISPASLKLPAEVLKGMFEGFPRTCIVVGDGEVALDSTRTLTDRMIEDMGEEKVELFEVKDATHDIVTMTFFEPERTETLKLIGAWLDSL